MKKGDKYSYFTIIKELDVKELKGRHFQCKCDCGIIKRVSLSNLRAGSVKSCGCLQIKNTVMKNTRHGMKGARIYKVWRGLKDRCNLVNSKDYKSYGGRGVTYDKKWEKFEGFYEDMKEGYSDNLTIDRINNDGNYCKTNCKWSTRTEQGRNKRNNVLYKGRCISEWCEELRIDKDLVYNRINILGWQIEKALFQEIIK